MDMFMPSVPIIGVSIVREGDLVSISVVYDLENVPSNMSATLDLFYLAAEMSTRLNVPLILEAEHGE